MSQNNTWVCKNNWYRIWWEAKCTYIYD